MIKAALEEHQTEEIDFETYASYRSELVEGLAHSHRQYDAALLTLSSGGLVLSVSIIGQLASDLTIGLWWLLFLSWVLFGLVVVSVLLSFIASQEAHKQQMHILDQAYKKDSYQLLQTEAPATIRVYRYNMISAILFSAAVVLTVIFGAIAIWPESST